MVAKISVGNSLYGALAYNGEKINKEEGRLLTTNRIYNDGTGTVDIRRAMERGNRYAARILTWASAGDMRNIALLERCRQEGRNAPDTGRFAVCPNCGNLYPSEYADWYCPACLTEGKRFVLFE